MVINPHLFKCSNPLYSFMESQNKFGKITNEHRGEDAHKFYTEDCMRLFTSFNNDFWILLADNAVVFKTDVETNFDSGDYSMLELIIIAENLAQIKPCKWTEYERLMFDYCIDSLVSRLRGLLPMLAAVECFKFIQEEIDVLIPHSEWSSLIENGEC